MTQFFFMFMIKVFKGSVFTNQTMEIWNLTRFLETAHLIEDLLVPGFLPGQKSPCWQYVLVVVGLFFQTSFFRPSTA